MATKILKFFIGEKILGYPYLIPRLPKKEIESDKGGTSTLKNTENETINLFLTMVNQNQNLSSMLNTSTPMGIVKGICNLITY